MDDSYIILNEVSKIVPEEKMFSNDDTKDIASNRSKKGNYIDFHWLEICRGGELLFEAKS